MRLSPKFADRPGGPSWQDRVGGPFWYKIMSNSVWQNIRAAIDARFNTILVSNGFATDAGKNVYYWRTLPFSHLIRRRSITRRRKKVRTLNFNIQSEKVTIHVDCVATGSDA